jgi:hypothetical protein
MAGPSRDAAEPREPAEPGPDPTRDEGAAAREREIGELEFLVGNACSRAINLLMAGQRERGVLREEMAFLSEKAGRLAELLSEAESD